MVWRDAVRQDRFLLEGFRCTSDPARRPDRRPLPHPRPWEVAVQKWARTQRPPSGTDERLRLGIDPDGDLLTTVGEVCLLRVEDDIAAVKMTGIALAAGRRGTGGHIADSAVEDLIRCSSELAAAQGASGMIVVAWVHPLNAPSQRMLDRNGFCWRSRISDDIEDWILQAGPAELTMTRDG